MCIVADLEMMAERPNDSPPVQFYT